MSKQPVYISIPEPCSQNWEEMHASDSGRYCDHCQKTVVDFTNWSDGEIYNFLSRHKDEHVCGRFNTAQLDRPISLQYQPHSKLYKMFVALGLTLIFLQVPEAKAQLKVPVSYDQLPQFSNKNDQNNDIKNNDTSCTTCGSIAGVVLDNKKKPVVDAFVLIKFRGVLKGGAVTDGNGSFLVALLKEGTTTSKSD